MADKTINQLTPSGGVSVTDEFAVWDASDAATRKATGTQLKAVMTDVDINGLTAVGTLDVADSVAVYDASAAANRKATINEIKTLATNVDINGLTSATPATDDTLPIYDTSVAGNRKVAISSIVAMVDTSVDITGLPSVGAGLDTADELILYDVSASDNKKTTVGTLAEFVGGGGGGSMDINGLPDAGSSFTDTDFVPFYDLSATGNRKTSGLDLARRLPVAGIVGTSPASLGQAVLATSLTAGLNTRLTLQSLYEYFVTTGIPALPASTVPALQDQIAFRDVSQSGSFQASKTTFLDINPILDHGAFVGLGDDDHAQYFNDTRGDARYARLAAVNTFTADIFTSGGDFGTGNAYRLVLGRNAGATPSPAAVYMSRAPSTSNQAIYPDDAGNWRTLNVSNVTNANYASGTVIGSQTSSLDEKDVLEELTPLEELLALVAEGAAGVRRFQYKPSMNWDTGEREGPRPYDGEEFEGVIIDYAPRYGMDRDDTHPQGKSLNTVAIAGDLLRVVAWLVEQNAALADRVAALENA